MNATSSRAHTVVTICYTQLELNAKVRPLDRRCVIQPPTCDTTADV